MESMEMAPGAIPRPGRVPKQRLSVPRISSAMVAALWNSSWKIDRVLRVFASEEMNRRRGGGGGRGGPTMPRRGLSWPTPGVGVATPWSPSVSTSGSWGLLAS